MDGWLALVATAVLLLVQGTHKSWAAQHYRVAEGPLHRWLQDPAAVRALRRVLGGAGSPLEAVHAATVAAPWPPAVSTRCLQDIGQVIASPALAYMLDASAKVPEGLLYGYLTHLGHWDECVDIRDQRAPTSDRVFHGQMCFVNIGGIPLQDNSREKPTASALERLKMPAQSASNLLASIFLKLGICVPSSCTAFDVQNLFNSILQVLPNIGNVKLTAFVSELECSTRDRPDLDVSDWFAVGILSFLLLLLVASTCYDVIVPKERKQNIFSSFSVVTNGRKLLSSPRKGGDTTLSCLHGIRVLSTLWVMLGHRYSGYTSGMASVNPMWMFTAMTDWYRAYVTNATLSVDTFFMMSGLLLGYIFFKRAPNSRVFNLPKYYIHRYIRLTPALAFVVLLNSTLLIRMGWGPMWYATWNYIRERCADSWWHDLLYITNWVSPMNPCVSHGWYLVVDMQLYWLAPLVLLPLTRVPRLGIFITILLMCFGIVSNFVVSYVYHLPGNMLSPADEETGRIFLVNYYTATYGRFVPYLEGLLLGYLIGDTSARGLKLKRLPCALALLSWLISAALMLVPLMTGYLFILDPLPSDLSAAFYNSLSRPAWSLGVVGLVYLCAVGNGGPVNALLSWNGFHILGRFCYCMYLIHIPIMATQLTSIRTPDYLSDSVILSAYASDILVCLVLAAGMSLVFESPFLAIEKEFFSWLARKNEKKFNASESGNSKDQSKEAIE